MGGLGGDSGNGRSCGWGHPVASAGEAEEDQDGAFRSDHVLATEPTNTLAELGAGIVVILSAMRLQGSRTLLISSGSTRSRISGASVRSVVEAHTVTDSVESILSS